jgi:hypothetical protein
MRLVKVNVKHYINTDLMIEVYPHLVEPGLTIVMAAPQADASGDMESARLKSYTIDLHGDEAENFTRWLDLSAEDGIQHADLPVSKRLA